MHTLRKPDRFGLLLAAGAALAIALLPFAVFKSNRIVPGLPQSMFGAMGSTSGWMLLLVLLCVGLAALWARGPTLRLLAAVAGIAALALAVGHAADNLTPPGNNVVRVAPGSGFWLTLAVCGLLATDAVTRLRPRPAVRVLMLALFSGATALALGSGIFDNLSILREYAVNAERFAHECRVHAALALTSLLAATLLALPVGILCHRLPRLRSGLLSALNLVQTIPAIALFGLLMAPLAALAAASPLAASLGIRGIGPAPALLALVLYSLLPIVANTVAGLARVSAATVEAARGMGLTNWQVLTRVELPLAMPVLLTGIRIVLVQNIGLVTIAALIGAGGLGTFVFQGIGQTAIDLVLLGAVPIVALALGAGILLDALIDVIDKVPT